jgi:hypothetical protein
MKILKWIMQLGHDRAMQRLESELSSRIQYHGQAEQLAYFQDKYEPKPESSPKDMFFKPKLTAKDHAVIRRELSDIYNMLFRDF